MTNFFIAAFLADFALGTVLLALPFFLIYAFNASSFTLGMFGAVGAAAYSAGVLATGRLADRINRKYLLLSGVVLFILIYACVPFLRSLPLVFAAYVAGCLSMACFWPVLQSWLSQGLARRHLVRSLSYFNVCWSAGFTCGFLSAGVLFGVRPFAPFALAIFLMACAGILLSRQPVISEATDGPARRTFLLTEKERPASSGRFLRIAWCANFCSWFILGTMRNLFPRLGTDLGFSSSLIGMLIFTMPFFQTVSFFVLGKTQRWHYRLAPLLIAQSAACAGLFVITQSRHVIVLMAAIAFLGIAGGITYFSSIFYGLYGSADKGRKSGIHESVIGSGALCGPLAGGIVAQVFGARAPYAAGMFVIALAMGIEIIIYFRGEKRHAI